ncbi:MAG TPA: hypothetical protein VM658_21310 [bacterium]|nr:hypothetical protein [bacterium]
MEEEQKHTCITCQFLCDRQSRSGYRDKDIYYQYIHSGNRKKALIGEEWAPNNLACFWGVFEKGIPGSDRKQIENDAINRDRRDECFWQLYNHNMTFEAAKILKEIELADRQAQKDRDLTKADLKLNEGRLQTMQENLAITRRQLRLSYIGLWIVGITSLAQVVFKLVEWKLFR